MTHDDGSMLLDGPGAAGGAGERYAGLRRRCQPLARRPWLAALAPALVLLLAAGDAAAAGWWLPGRGASNYSRGGANIADPGDPSALYTNPSGLAGLDGIQVMVDSNLMLDWRRYERAPDDLDGNGRDTTYDPVQNPMKPWWSPGLFASGNLESLGLGRLALGLGVYGPIRTDNEWPEDGPQRYAQIRAYSLEVHYALAVAYELPWWGIRIGATGMMLSHDVRFRMKLNLTELSSGPEAEDYDVSADISASQHLIPMGVFSVSASPWPWLVIAASLKPAYDVDARGTVDVGIEGLGDAVSTTGDEVRVRLKTAPVLRLAAQVRDPGLFAVELAWVWEGWHRNDAVVTQPQDIMVEVFGLETPLETFRTPTHWRDTWSLRLGGQYWALPERLAVRAGSYYERSAVPDEWLSAGAFDLDKLGFTLGGRVELPWGLWVDLGGGYVHWFSKSIDDSRVKIINALNPDSNVCVTYSSTECWPAANGEYTNHQWMIVTAVGARFDI